MRYDEIWYDMQCSIPLNSLTYSTPSTVYALITVKRASDRFYSHLLDKGQSLVSAVVEEIISDVSSTLGRCKRFTSLAIFSMLWQWIVLLSFQGVWWVSSSSFCMSSLDCFIHFLLGERWAIWHLGLFSSTFILLIIFYACLSFSVD